MSILFLNCIEQSKCKQGTKSEVIYKYCKILAKDWPEKQVYPPYHEWTDNILNLADMRKFKFQQNSKLKPNATSSSKTIDSDL